MSRIVAVAAAALMLSAAPAAAKDYAATARNVLPGGQHGSIPPRPGAHTQALMYDALTPLGGNVTDADIAADFTSEGFGVAPDGPGRKERVPRKGVTEFDDPDAPTTLSRAFPYEKVGNGKGNVAIDAGAVKRTGVSGLGSTAPKAHPNWASNFLHLLAAALPVPRLTGIVGANAGAAGDFTDGGFWYLDKDLRRLVGAGEARKYRLEYCAGGDAMGCAQRSGGRSTRRRATCRPPGARLTRPPGGRTPPRSGSTFRPGLLSTTLRYTNRPSGIQQVVSFSGHRPRR